MSLLNNKEVILKVAIVITAGVVFVTGLTSIFDNIGYTETMVSFYLM